MDFLRPIIELFLPGKCYEDVVLNLDVSNAECMKVALSKGLGYGMILGGSLVKLPQILKVTAAKSAQGLSIASVCLDLTAVTATTAYNYSAQYPFSAWGEGVFLMVETALILALALHYSSKTTQAVISSILYSIICFFIGQDGTHQYSLVRSAHIRSSRHIRQVDPGTGEPQGGSYRPAINDNCILIIPRLCSKDLHIHSGDW